MRKDFILIDLENVQPTNLHRLQSGSFEVRIFVGSQQSKVSFEMAQTVQGLGARAEYVRIDGNGRNALDFHIAFYIGQLAAKHPGAAFHVISKDTGFDPLIKHLAGRRIACRRHPSLDNFDPGADPVALVVDNLARRRGAKPKTVKALISTIHVLLAGHADATDPEWLVAELQKRGIVKVSGAAVTYAALREA